MKTKLEKALKRINDNYGKNVDKNFNDYHPVIIADGFMLRTTFNIIAMAIVSLLYDKKGNTVPFIPDQIAWLDGFKAGYKSASEEVNNERNA
jgi:hypothetical protein